MAFKKPQVTKVKTDIQSLSIYLRSVKKFGKTTLFRDLILEKFNGNPEKGLLIGIGAEMGYSILDNLNATQIENWEELEDLKDWLITQKGKEHDIEIVAFDVIDELIPIAEEEIMRLSKKDGKPCKSFNGAFGGYGEPRKRFQKLLKDFFSDLKKAGIQPFAISHTKVKNVKEKGDEGEGYQTLTSNLSNDYESIFGDIFDCVLTGYIDRDVEGGKVTSATRKLYLRGNGFIDAGCRFADNTVPEYIVFDKPNMAKDFIEVLEEGLRKSRTVDKLDKDQFKVEQEKERQELSKKAEQFTSDLQNKEDTDEQKEEKLNKIKENMAKIDIEKLQEIIAKHKVTNLGDASIIPTQCLNEILELI
ncbi:AAA family ATPase [Clostridium sp.]|uniref:AAA family ATPase n=1 Tax=Clostridium sp. TaxID=1506 RepID=UPI001D9BF76D|nr:AAA family ATPase [Clostridium sp.]MBS5307679.1 AAA family ATPase [Clostridium sp.]